MHCFNTHKLATPFLFYLAFLIFPQATQLPAPPSCLPRLSRLSPHVPNIIFVSILAMKMHGVGVLPFLNSIFS